MFGTRQQLAKIKLDGIEFFDNQVNISCKVKDLSIIFESDLGKTAESRAN